MKKTENTQPTPAFKGFETFFKEDGLFYFRLIDTAGEAVLFGKGYSSERSRDNGILALRNAAKEGHYEVQTSKKGRHFFVLKAANRQEIGRSRLFEHKKDLDALIKTLKAIDDNIPILPTPAPETTAPQAETPAPVAQPETLTLADEAPSPKPDDAAKMPRYKFSVIYYPNSQVWTLKNDFSGEAQQLKSCDGAAIADFLLRQIPAEEGLTPAKTENKPAGNQAAEKTEAPEPTENPVFGQAEVTIRNKSGKPAGKAINREDLGMAEVALPTANKDDAPRYNVQFVAQSLETRQIVGIGNTEGLVPSDGKFNIPLSSVRALLPGAYLFIAKAYQGAPDQKTLKFYGSTVQILL